MMLSTMRIAGRDYLSSTQITKRLQSTETMIGLSKLLVTDMQSLERSAVAHLLSQSRESS